MNAHTILSAKGQVVIPKDIRDRLGLVPGEQLTVTEMAEGVFLKATSRKAGRSFDEIEAELQALIQYDGSPVSIEDMNVGIARAAADSAARRDCAGR
ncbi:AbrB/MazE/SpoVT family DNA-binding domain-containing protein [Sphingomonas montana]|uniref:AbrB/MazE/SpoVT family DNA-binding domain-containing protein n=1 Tax=Sphingomonas montana TaxID=1843236 RepID=UPI00096CF0BE|nr:AbrB/MazE/SpoVT family DNA-binding domain-containing protein [Sphingomonas montana]